MRRLFVAVSALLVAALGYATADVFDLVPGVLTRTITPGVAQATVAAGPKGTPVLLPTPAAAVLPLALPTGAASTVDKAALRKRLTQVLADPDLSAGVGAVVRDGLTGQSLFDKAGTTARTPASTMKLVSALAVVDALDPAATMTTRVVAGPTASQIVLVAGGDTMLARGAGRTGATVGRAGLGTLAGQVATSLAGRTTVTLRLDLSYAAGPSWPSTWSRADLASGATQTVRMIGLGDQRPDAVAGKVSPENPPAEVAKAFVAALKAKGVTATLAPQKTWSRAAAPDARLLGAVSSASYAAVLEQALLDSDNALMENLARQAALAAGGAPTAAGVVAHTKAVLTSHGLSTAGVVLVDASGLSHGQKVPPDLIARVLELGTRGTVPAMAEVVAGLPVAGLTGTLDSHHHRFDTAATRAVAGIPRAKTGTLLGTSALAGTTVSADGHLLTFVVLADHVPRTGEGTLGAREALDRFAAALTTCGCLVAPSPGASSSPTGATP